jgi:hypothetical protein
MRRLKEGRAGRVGARHRPDGPRRSIRNIWNRSPGSIVALNAGGVKVIGGNRADSSRFGHNAHYRRSIRLGNCGSRQGTEPRRH